MKIGVASIVEDPDLIMKRRRQIVAAATELFSSQGFYRTTIKEIANLAGISSGLIYQYVRETSVAYSLDGACTNQAESFLARLRRMVDGQHHHVSPRYLNAYANHAAWLEDHKRLDNGALMHRALGLALKHPISRQWKGYWQRGLG